MYALVTFLGVFLPLYCVYQLGSLAGLFSERSGVANVAIEGNMLVGAVLFSIIQQLLLQTMTPLVALVLSILISIPLAAIFMLLLSLMTNRYMADHIISGTAMNILAPALMMLLYLVLSPNVQMVGGSPKWSGNIPALVNEWVISMKIDGVTNNSLNWVYFVFFAITIIILIVSTFALNKTAFGNRLKASGENPYSLETAGISVAKTRRTSLYIAGLLSSLAGVVFAVKGTFFFTMKGSGFIAIGIIILGQYRILGTVIGSLVMASFIGMIDTVEFMKGTSDLEFLKQINLLKAIPYLLPLLGLIFLKTSYVPKSVGKNFKKDQR